MHLWYCFTGNTDGSDTNSPTPVQESKPIRPRRKTWQFSIKVRKSYYVIINRRITIMTACGAGAARVDRSINFTPSQLDLDTSHWPIHHCRYVIHMFKSNSSHKLVELQPSQVKLHYCFRVDLQSTWSHNRFKWRHIDWPSRLPRLGGTPSRILLSVDPNPPTIYNRSTPLTAVLFIQFYEANLAPAPRKLSITSAVTASISKCFGGLQTVFG